MALSLTESGREDALYASFPSPPISALEFGPLAIRAYAIFIIIGALLAIWIGERRYVARGGRRGAVADVAVWAIPAGIIGARVYHVLTTPELYFGPGRDPVEALYIWNGGLGIWGAVPGGAIGAYIACRKYGVKPSELADAIAPGLLVAQAVGRLGNYFNQELFGRPTEVAWALQIDPEFRPSGFEQYATFHPTFLYEMLWNLAAAALLVAIDRKVHLTNGRAFWLYVMLYSFGRLWIETMRIDTAHLIGSFRLNVWTAIAVFGFAAVMFWWCGRGSAARSSDAQV